MEEHLKGATIVADQHFAWASKRVDDLKILTPSPKPSEPSIQDDLKNATVETKKAKKRNEDLIQLRSRIESLFGDIKTRFLCFSTPFAEDEDELDKIFYFACGVNNYINTCAMFDVVEPNI